jgi:hypothetical protein
LKGMHEFNQKLQGGEKVDNLRRVDRFSQSGAPRYVERLPLPTSKPTDDLILNILKVNEFYLLRGNIKPRYRIGKEVVVTGRSSKMYSRSISWHPIGATRIF